VDKERAQCQQAIAGNTAAAGNYANLYNTASTPVQSPVGAIIGGGLQAGGQVGAAAMCPVQGSLILLQDGSEIPVENLKAGDELRGIDGKPCPVNSSKAVAAQAIELRGSRGLARVSSDHTFMLAEGGYEFSTNSNGKRLLYGDGDSVIIANSLDIGMQTVYVLDIGGSHTYRTDGFWSLS
jgi:hypothetical protein